MLTKTESRILYWFDWTWDRSEECVLAFRFYLYCVQFGAVVVVPVLVKVYGWRPAARHVVYAINWRYVYGERHSWDGTESEPVAAVELIITLRQERAERERASWTSKFDGPALPDHAPAYRPAQPLSPLTDRLPDYWTNKPALPWPTHQGVTAELELILTAADNERIAA